MLDPSQIHVRRSLAGAGAELHIKEGMRADVIILDKEFNVKSVFVKGERIK